MHSPTGSPAFLPKLLGLQEIAEATSELKAASKGHKLVTLKKANARLSDPSTASADPHSRHSVVNSTDIFPLQPHHLQQEACLHKCWLKSQHPKPAEKRSRVPEEPPGEQGLKDKGDAKSKTQMKSTLKDGGIKPTINSLICCISSSDPDTSIQAWRRC